MSNLIQKINMSLEEDLLEIAKQDTQTKLIVTDKLLELQDMWQQELN